jgi:hypothetical protein
MAPGCVIVLYLYVCVPQVARSALELPGHLTQQRLWSIHQSMQLLADCGWLSLQIRHYNSRLDPPPCWLPLVCPLLIM